MPEPRYAVYKDEKWLFTDDLDMIREVFGIEVPKKPYPCPKCGSNNIYFHWKKKQSECLQCKYKWKAET